MAVAICLGVVAIVGLAFYVRRRSVNRAGAPGGGAPSQRRNDKR